MSKIGLQFFFIVALMSFFACSSKGQQDSVTIPPPPEDTLKQIKLVFVGDIMGHGPQVESAYDPATKTYNYQPCFQYVSPILEDADLAVGNLEVTLPGKPPYKGYPMFRSPDALATALRLAGFDMLVTANNHSNDGGLNGVVNTIDVVKRLGFFQTGTFKNKEERDDYYPLIVRKEADGHLFRLAFLNYTYGTNGLPTKPPSVVNMIDRDLIKKDLKRAKSLKPDAIIVVTHWGAEYQLDESAEQRSLTKFIFENGADLVIGAHPHVIQPIKQVEYESDSGVIKKGLVVYSLGNFISNQRQTNTDLGLMFEVEFTKNVKSGAMAISQHDYIPVWRYIDNPSSKHDRTYYTIPSSAIENDSTNVLKISTDNRTKMQTVTNRLRKHLAKYESKERKIDLSTILIEDQIVIDSTTIDTIKSKPDFVEDKRPPKTAKVDQEPLVKKEPGQDVVEQSDTNTDNKLYYCVRFMSGSQKKSVEQYQFPDVRIIEETDNKFVYLTGKFEERKDCQLHLSRIKATFSDAYIVRFQNGKIVK